MTEDVVRSLTVSIALMGVTAVAVVHHTDCGLHARSFALRDTLAAAGVSGTGLELHSSPTWRRAFVTMWRCSSALTSFASGPMFEVSFTGWRMVG